MENPFPIIEILHEDEDILVIAKPADLVVNRADSVKVDSLQDWLEERYKNDKNYQQSLKENEIFAERSGIGHRLDKDTSGVLVIGKNTESLLEIMRQFKERETKKEYLALVHGYLPNQKGIIDATISRHPQNRETFTVMSGGRPSVTEFFVQEEFSKIDDKKLRQHLAEFPPKEPVKDLTKFLRIYQGFSLVKLIPKTGRTHQIRVHMQYLHCPLVGDERYAGRKRGRLDSFWCPRHFLHAQSLKIIHPTSKKEMTFTAPLPDDLQEVLTYMLE